MPTRTHATPHHLAQFLAQPIRQHDVALLHAPASGPALHSIMTNLMAEWHNVWRPQALLDDAGNCFAIWGCTFEPLLAEAHLWLAVSDTTDPSGLAHLPSHLSNSITEMHSKHPRIVAECGQGDFLRVKWLLDVGFTLLERPAEALNPNLIFTKAVTPHG